MAGLDGSDTSSTVYIDDLVPTNPATDDAKSQGDDHLRFIKRVLKNTFPNIDGPVTATQAELNITDGLTATVAELNVLDGVNATLTAAELNKLDGVTATTAEINYLAGVTSAIQTQLDAKGPAITGAATTIDTENLTVSRALVSDGSGKVGVSATTSTEIGYVSGVTSAIQTQLSGKQATITGGATTIVSSNLTASRALVSDSSGKVAASSVTSTELGLLSGLTSLSSITQMTAVSPTSGSTVDFTSIPSTVKKITVVLNGISISTTADIGIRLGDSGGVETTGYTCTDGDTTLFYMGNIGAAGTLSGLATIANVSGNIWVMSYSSSDSTTPNGCGTKTLSGTLDRVQLVTASGTFDAGTVNVLYE